MTAGTLFEHRWGPRWIFRQAFRATSNEVEYRSLYADSFSNPGNSYLDPERRRLGRYAWLSDTDVEMWNADQHVEGHFQSGGVSHRVLTGLDVLRFAQEGRSAFDSPAHLGGGVHDVDVFAPVAAGYLPPSMTDDPRATQEQLGIYLQDQLRIGERWTAVAGLRQDWTRSELDGGSREDTDATTARLGAMYAFESGVSPYLSYSESFQPVPGTDLFASRFDPLRGEQLEAGVKYENATRTLYAAAAAFDLQEENRLIADPVNPLNQVQAGSTKTQGAELELLGRFGAGLQVNAHYNWLDNDPQLDGVPRHQAAAWASRGMGKVAMGHVTFGLGVRWFSAFTDGTAPRVPAVTLGDAMLRWEASRWLVALNANNLTDETYASTCLPRGDCFYGARRTLSLSAGLRY
jgi:iron complex outermembrane receptor protein